jgi:hypothetical protein
MNIARQLLKEFWLPVFIGLAWTAYNLFEQKADPWTLRTFINIFFPAFFFASWLVAQWYRVRKQQKVEGDLGGIESHIKQMLNSLDEKTNDLIGHITGGNSFCFLMGETGPSNKLERLTITNRGKHPLYNVTVRVIDLEDLNQNIEKIRSGAMPNTVLDGLVGQLIPRHFTKLKGTLHLGDGEIRRFNVFFTALNGSFTQLLQFRKVNNSWLWATRVQRVKDTNVVHIATLVEGEAQVPRRERDLTNIEILFEQRFQGFPLDDQGQVNWEGH